MGKWDVDFEDYDPSSGGGSYDGEEPKKGTYDAKLVACQEHTSGAGNEGLKWTFEITEGDYAGFWGYTYSNMEAAKWKTQQIVKAISGGAEKPVKLDPGSDGDSAKTCKTVQKAKPVRMRIRPDQYEGEYKARVGEIMPMEGKAGSSKKSGPVDDDEPTGGKKGKKKKKGDDPF